MSDNVQREEEPRNTIFLYALGDAEKSLGISPQTFSALSRLVLIHQKTVKLSLALKEIHPYLQGLRVMFTASSIQISTPTLKYWVCDPLHLECQPILILL